MIKTTAENVSQHHEGIEWEALSKTFQHAIIVTQLLGLRYIWIDSLCIIQGDRTDFEKECARMHMIYLNYYCMIAANDAKCGEEGFLEFWDELDVRYQPDVNPKRMSPRKNPGFCPQTALRLLYPLKTYWSNWSYKTHGALSTRGWAYQEQQLAPRILHYTKWGVLWECRIGMGLGDSANLEFRRLIHNTLMNQKHVQHHWGSAFCIMDRHLSPDINDLMMQWMDIVEKDSQKFLTFRKDKLPALSALAVTVRGLTIRDHASQAGEYPAEIWSSALSQQLLRHPTHYLSSEDATTLKPLPALP